MVLKNSVDGLTQDIAESKARRGYVDLVSPFASSMLNYRKQFEYVPTFHFWHNYLCLICFGNPILFSMYLSTKIQQNDI